MWQPLPAFSRPRLGRERGDQAVGGWRRARIVSRTSSCSSAACSAGACAGRDLLLAVAELGVVLLEHDPLRLERRRRARRRSPATAVMPIVEKHSARVDRHVARRRPTVASENSFSNATSQRRPRSASRSLHPLQERALADRRRVAVEADRGRRASRPCAARTAAPGTCRGRARGGPRRPAPCRAPAGAGRGCSSPASRPSGRCRSRSGPRGRGGWTPCRASVPSLPQ